VSISPSARAVSYSAAYQQPETSEQQTMLETPEKSGTPSTESSFISRRTSAFNRKAKSGLLACSEDLCAQGGR
jgi:hypothetical protein